MLEWESLQANTGTVLRYSCTEKHIYCTAANKIAGSSAGDFFINLNLQSVKKYKSPETR
jgi:hypothetical protein